MKVLDLYAGAGGWDVALERLGHTSVRVEIDPEANTTADHAGYPTAHGDVLTAPIEGYSAMVASPPCHKFAAVGDGTARPFVDLVTAPDLTGFPHEVQLLAYPLRWTLQHRPRWTAWEQVTEALPAWRLCAGALQDAGYHVWTGTLDASHYGVPQTRRRGVLMASLTPFRLPKRTRTTSIRDALGWEYGTKFVSTYATNSDRENRGVRMSHEPAFTVTSRFSSGEVHAPGQPMRRMSAAEAGRLQTFPYDYPWSGRVKSIERQIGNAIPPLLAQAIVGALTQEDR